MSDVVKRLAGRWRKHREHPSTPDPAVPDEVVEQWVDEDDRHDARWWLRAIADEVERARAGDHSYSDQAKGHAARWLRPNADFEDAP